MGRNALRFALLECAVWLLCLSAVTSCREHGARRPEPPWRSFAWIPPSTVTVGSVEVRGNPPRPFATAGFWMGRREVTVAEYAAFLNAQGWTNDVGEDFVVRRGVVRVRWGRGRRPATGMTSDEAAIYCCWRAGQWGRSVRLPTEEEWECAARGGIEGARYPWGWGDPAGRARFAARRAAAVGSFAANPFGLRDMAGNVFEWCAGDGAATEDRATARGGSWAEDAASLLVFRRALFRRDYRNRDVGFRILIEGDPPGPPGAPATR